MKLHCYVVIRYSYAVICRAARGLSRTSSGNGEIVIAVVVRQLPESLSLEQASILIKRFITK